jgi:hypothetical protein
VCPPGIEALSVHTLPATDLTPRKAIHARRSIQILQAHGALTRDRLPSHVETPFTVAGIVPPAAADWAFQPPAVSSALRDPIRHARLVYCTTAGGAAPYEL